MRDMRIKNDAGVFGARHGYVEGVKRLFTHRSKKTGKFWGEDIPVGKTFGMWVPGDKIKCWIIKEIRSFGSFSFSLKNLFL